MNTPEKLLENYKKGQRHLQQFWELLRNNTIMNLSETNQMFNEIPWLQLVKEPRIRDLVQIKESSPIVTWKVGQIIEMSENLDI